MKCFQYEKLDLSIFCETYCNGMELHMIPLKGISQTFAVINVNYGANDIALINPATKDKVDFPLGTAHFLEHLIFGNMHDIKKIRSESGASINAKTSYNNTEFLISTSGNIETIIPKLLSAIFNQEFTNFKIENEKKVISEEILMYQDKANWVVYRDLLMQMYPDSPICTDVAGTRESINSLDKELLEQAHGIYYRPDNVKLVVVGDVNPIKMSENVYNTVIRDQYSFEMKGYEYEPFYPNIQYGQSKNSAIVKNNSHDLFSIGFMREIEGNKNGNYLATLVAVESLFGLGSSLAVNLNKESLITNQWGYSNYIGPNYDFTVVSGSTVNIDPLIEKLCEELQEIRRNGLNSSEIDRAVKKIIGQKMLKIENINEFALAYSEDLSNGLNYFTTLNYLQQIDGDFINSRLESIFALDYFLKSIHASIPMNAK